MGEEFDRQGWPGWTDPVRSHLRGRWRPWAEVRPFLHYETTLRKGFHPVTAWTPNHVMTLRRDLNGRPMAVTVPRAPGRHEQELWS